MGVSLGQDEGRGRLCAAEVGPMMVLRVEGLKEGLRCVDGRKGLTVMVRPYMCGHKGSGNNNQQPKSWAVTRCVKTRWCMYAPCAHWSRPGSE